MNPLLPPPEYQESIPVARPAEMIDLLDGTFASSFQKPITALSGVIPLIVMILVLELRLRIRRLLQAEKPEA